MKESKSNSTKPGQQTNYLRSAHVRVGDIWKPKWLEGRSDYVLILKIPATGRRTLAECLNADGEIQHISLAAFYTDFTCIYRIPE